MSQLSQHGDGGKAGVCLLRGIGDWRRRCVFCTHSHGKKSVLYSVLMFVGVALF
jgi:hypothetical protein